MTMEPTQRPGGGIDRTGWLLAGICLIGIVVSAYMQSKNAPPPNPAPVGPAIGQQGNNGGPANPAPGQQAQAGNPNPNGGNPQEPAPEPQAEEQVFLVESGASQFEFTNLGGGIKTVHLNPKKFAGAEEEVLNRFASAPIGALSRGVDNVETQAYALVSAEGAIPVIYEAKTPEGLRVRKTWTPSDNPKTQGYLWDLQVQLKNEGAAPFTSDGLYLYAGVGGPVQESDWIKPAFAWNADGDADYVDVNWFGGNKLLFRSPQPNRQEVFVQTQWAGIFNRFYTQLLAPTVPGPTRVWTSKIANIPFSTPAEGEEPGKPVEAIHGGMSMGALSIAPGAEQVVGAEVYAGPRAYTILKHLDRDRDKVLFYGWFGAISRLLMNALVLFQGWVASVPGSYGIAILLVTFMIRLIMWPLHSKSTNSMKRMAKLSPKMNELREKYKDNPQKMNSEVMKLYKEYGVNPFQGCLPLFIQMPVFFGYYRMLMAAVELRGHGFLWVKDLSMPDTIAHVAGVPINPLPVLMAVTMFIQMRMTPKSQDKQMQAQQRIFMIMPFMFLFFCYSFASALALYWTAQNVFSIGQTWLLQRRPEPELEKKKPAAPPSPGGGSPKKTKPKPPRTGGGKGKKKK